MVDFLANRCAASLGLSKVFADGNPEDSNWRSNQLFTWPAIQEFQHELEQIADWCLYRWKLWAEHKKLINAYICQDYMDYVDWEWKGLDDIDEVAKQNGIKLALENCTTTYKEVLGNSWKETLKQVAYERKWMKDNGIVPPQELMISGGQADPSISGTSS